jgi:NADPH:quinone reductase-like Zn-dependent oxidoreductase
MSYRRLGPLRHIIGTRLVSIGRSQTVVNFVGRIENDDLAFTSELLAAGGVNSVIDRRCQPSDVPDSLRYRGTTHARGNVIVTV